MPNAHTYHRAARNSGFTLIELAIVLVVIGLLIGGVFVGRNMLRSSEVSSIKVDAEAYIRAVVGFRTKYEELPGDMARATTLWGNAGGTGGTNYTTDCYASASASSPATCNGNGDGKIGTGASYKNETLRAWQHLVDGGFVQGRFSGTTDDVHVAGTNAPSSRVSGGMFGLEFVGLVSSHTYLFDGNYGHVLYFGGKNTSAYSNNFPVGGIIMGREAQMLDTKFDEGKPAAGSLRSWRNGTYVPCANHATPAQANYTSASGQNCSLIFTTGF